MVAARCSSSPSSSDCQTVRSLTKFCCEKPYDAACQVCRAESTCAMGPHLCASLMGPAVGIPTSSNVGGASKRQGTSDQMDSKADCQVICFATSSQSRMFFNGVRRREISSPNLRSPPQTSNASVHALQTARHRGHGSIPHSVVHGRTWRDRHTLYRRTMAHPNERKSSSSDINRALISSAFHVAWSPAPIACVGA